MGGLTLGALLAALVAFQDPSPLDRARELVGRLVDEASEPALLQERLQETFVAFVAEHDAFHGEAALLLAEAMYAHGPGTWSAFCLEGILRRLGRYERAEEVLAGHLETVTVPEQRAQILERRAILAAGAGWRERELDHLGRALALDGLDAQQMLGRLALFEGRKERARVLFRVLVERLRGAREGAGEVTPESIPWALRGWGLALLPPASEPGRDTLDGGSPR